MSRADLLSSPPAAGAFVPESVSRRWVGLVFIAMGQLLLALDATIMNVALPTVQRSLGFGDAERHWVVSAYLFSFAALLLLGGRIADRLGHRRAFLVSLLGFAAASALGGAAQHWHMLVLTRALQGAFGALLAPSALSLVAVGFTAAAERARAFGVYAAVAACGGALGLVLGGLLVRYADWRWCLYVNVPFAALACAGARFTLAASTPAPGRSAWLRTLWGLLRERARAVASLVAALSIAAMSGLFLLLTYYFQVVRGWTPLQTGLAFLPLSVGGMFGSSVLARRLSLRLEPRVLVTGALGAAALGLALMARVDADSSYAWQVAPAQLLVGIGIGSAMMPIFSVATLGVEPRNAGLASALITTAQQLGGASGAALLNTLAARTSLAQIGTHAGESVTGALVHGHAVAAGCGAGLALLAAFSAAWLPVRPVPAR